MDSEEVNGIKFQNLFVSVSLKKTLKNLGWKENIFDQYTMALIFLLLENEKEFQINGHASS